MTGFEIVISTALALLAFHIQFSYRLMINEERSRTILLTHTKYWASKLENYEDLIDLYKKIFKRSILMNSEGEKLIFSVIPASREILNEETQKLSSNIELQSQEDQENSFQIFYGEKEYLKSIREGILSGELLPNAEDLKDLTETEAAGCVLLKHELLEWILNSETISESSKSIKSPEHGARMALTVLSNIARAKIICKILIDHCEAYSSKKTASKMMRRLLFQTNF